MTYTMTTTIEGRDAVHTETATRLLEGDVEALREAAKIVAEPGDTIIHQVTQER